MLARLFRLWCERWANVRDVYDGGEKEMTVLDHLRRLDEWKLVKKTHGC